jgi:hypothetical protein
MAEDKTLVKLGQIAKLLALFITQEAKTKTAKVMKLVEYGFESSEIADLLGMELKRVNETIKLQSKKPEGKNE